MTFLFRLRICLCCSNTRIQLCFRQEIQANIQNGTGSKGYACDQCPKAFTQKRSLVQHVKSVHQKVCYECPKCRNTFSRQTNLRRHESTCKGVVTFPCDRCDQVLKTAPQLQFHQKIKHKIQTKRAGKAANAMSPSKRHSPKPGTSSYNCRQCEAKFQHQKQLQVHHAKEHRGGRSTASIYNCHKCPAQFRDRQALHAHHMRVHYQVGGGLHPDPFRPGQEPWLREDGSVDEGLRDCYGTNRPLILERFREGSVESLYNIPTSPGITVEDIGQALQGIYDRQSHAFKVNLAFGFIMRHVETGQYRFFRPFDNVNAFDAPILISRRSDIDKVLKKLREMDIMAEMEKNRPNTKWRLVLFTNIRVKVYNTNYSLGTVEHGPLPHYIRHAKSIIPLDKNPVTKSIYTDHLCLFRCLCLHRYGSVDPDRVEDLFQTWQSRYTEREFDELLGNQPVQPHFRGVQLRELPEFEQRFEVNVLAYSLREDGIVVSVFKSTDRYKETMYINQHENHCSFVTDFSQYAKKFQCQLCDRLFNHNGNFLKHASICDKRTLFDYPGGFYKERKTIFEQLEEYGILVPTDERTFPWFAVFDFESMLVKLEGDATEKLEWTQQHVPISVSVCSNVPGSTEPRCFVNSDMDALLGQMVDVLTNIQLAAAAYAEEKWGAYLNEMKDILSQMSDKDEERAAEKEKAKAMYGQFEGYMSTLPVLGFNR